MKLYSILGMKKLRLFNQKQHRHSTNTLYSIPNVRKNQQTKLKKEKNSKIEIKNKWRDRNHLGRRRRRRRWWRWWRWWRWRRWRRWRSEHVRSGAAAAAAANREIHTRVGAASGRGSATNLGRLGFRDLPLAFLSLALHTCRVCESGGWGCFRNFGGSGLYHAPVCVRNMGKTPLPRSGLHGPWARTRAGMGRAARAHRCSKLCFEPTRPFGPIYGANLGEGPRKNHGPLVSHKVFSFFFSFFNYYYICCNIYLE